MFSWIRRLQEVPMEELRKQIVAQKNEISIKQRDLETMELILAQRTQERAWAGLPEN